MFRVIEFFFFLNDFGGYFHLFKRWVGKEFNRSSHVTSHVTRDGNNIGLFVNDTILVNLKNESKHFQQAYFAETRGFEVSQHEGVGGVGDQVPVLAHDLHLVDLVPIEGLEDDARSRPQVFDDDLTQAHVGHLKLVLVDGTAQAAVKQLDATT